MNPGYTAGYQDSFFFLVHVSIKTLNLNFEEFYEICPFGFQCWSEKTVFYSEHVGMQVQVFYLEEKNTNLY